MRPGVALGNSNEAPVKVKRERSVTKSFICFGAGMGRKKKGEVRYAAISSNGNESRTAM